MKKYKLLKDYKVNSMLPGTHLVLLRGATVELSGEGGFGDGSETFEEIKEEGQEEKCGNEGCLGIHTTTCSQFLSEGDEIDMVSKKPQEDYEEQLNKYSHTVEPQEKEECVSCGSETSTHAPDCRREEECKHENGQWQSNALFGAVFVCPDCPAGSCRPLQRVKEPQPNQLPSDWICDRAAELSEDEDSGEGEEVSEECFRQAIIDFLDSVAEGKYKL